jgi:hypothetical protein
MSGASCGRPLAVSAVHRRRKALATGGSAEKIITGMARALVGVPSGFLHTCVRFCNV